jgi:cell division septation protein DedD
MPRDYKHHVVRRRKRRPVPRWLGVMAGLLIGVFIAVIAYLKLQAPQTPSPQAPAPAFMPEAPAAPGMSATPGNAKQEEKAAVSAPSRPRFDFYTILPEMQVVIPEEEINAKSAPVAVRPVEKPEATGAKNPAAKPQKALPRTKAHVKPAPPARPETRHPARGNYFLQTDSVRSGDEADRYKARVALLGFDASVHTVRIRQTTYHRVRVGPFADFSALDRARTLLRQHGIASTPMMIGR